MVHLTAKPRGRSDIRWLNSRQDSVFTFWLCFSLCWPHSLHLVVELAAGTCSTTFLEAWDARKRASFPDSLAEIPRRTLIWPSLGFVLFLLGTIIVCILWREGAGMQMAECEWRTLGRTGSRLYFLSWLHGPRRITREQEWGVSVLVPWRKEQWAEKALQGAYSNPLYLNSYFVQNFERRLISFIVWILWWIIFKKCIYM